MQVFVMIGSVGTVINAHDRFIWNNSMCACECDKSCDFREYLDYVNCKSRKKVDQ